MTGGFRWVTALTVHRFAPMRFLKVVPWLFAVVAVAVAAALLRVERLAAAEPPAVIERIREVQRLEVLEVTVHKKVTFAPEVVPSVLPAETEVVASNLDSAQTAAMLESAQGELRASVASDPRLRQRAQ